MAKKKLFVSYTRLLNPMKSGEVVPEDLEDSLFYLGYAHAHLDEDARDHVKTGLAFRLRSQKDLDAGKPEHEGADLEGAVRVYAAIKSAVSKAKDQGRVVFRAEDGRASFEQLNALLARNGIDISTVQHLEKEEYIFPLVANHYKDIVDVI